MLFSFPENLCLVTIQNDTQWSSFVYWTVEATIAAAELGIDSKSANYMPAVDSFGPLFSRMFKDTIASVGNYLELYERNLEPTLPLGGRNQMASLLRKDPLHYVPPGFSLQNELK